MEAEEEREDQPGVGGTPPSPGRHPWGGEKKGRLLPGRGLLPRGGVPLLPKLDLGSVGGSGGRREVREEPLSSPGRGPRAWMSGRRRGPGGTGWHGRCRRGSPLPPKSRSARSGALGLPGPPAGRITPCPLRGVWAPAWQRDWFVGG